MLKYRAGIIGCGRVANAHAQGYLNLPMTDLVAASDLIEPNLQEFGSKYNIPVLYTDYQEMLDKEALDIVSVCTWPEAHCELSVTAASCGVNVICEKPMALSLAEADKMIEAASQTSVKLAISHQRRCCPYHLHAKQLIEEGAIGKLIAVRGEGGGGAGFGLMNTATHLFDQIRIFAGDVDWVVSHVTTGGRDITPEDIHQAQRGGGIGAGNTFTAYFSFKNGVYATVDSFGDFGSELIGTEGRILLRQGSRVFQHPFAMLKYGSDSGDWQPLKPPADQLKWNPHTRTIFEMVECIEAGREHRSSGWEGRAALDMIMAVYESQIRQRRVQLPLEFINHPLERWQKSKRT